jgi:myosin-crossreactive antigen
MYYSSGNYEAFARPRKPAGVENKTAWFVGSGLASLAGAAFLVRDGHMPGERITILEQQAIAGGALDGLDVPEKGFVIRGGREMEDISSACGTCSARSPRWRSKAPACSTSSTGSTRTIPTTRCSAPR